MTPVTLKPFYQCNEHGIYNCAFCLRETAPPQEEPTKCEWKQGVSSYWKAGCVEEGALYVPLPKGATFCCYCGKTLEAVVCHGM